MNKKIENIVAIDVLLKMATEYKKNEVLNIDFIQQDLECFDMDNLAFLLNKMYDMDINSCEDEDFLVEVVNKLISNCIKIETLEKQQVYIFSYENKTFALEY